MELHSYKRIKNGGFEQGILQIMSDEGLASKLDKKRLAELKSLPQDRTEIISTHSVNDKTEVEE